MDVDDTLPVQSSAIAGGSMSSSKVSIFGAKSGFVIPRNKLSGSLVPVFRAGCKKPGGVDAGSVENGKPIRRKTKWGSDLTQDPFVRKGRLLAYQTRLEQITRQLVSGKVREEDGEDFMGIDSTEAESVGDQIDNELLKSLEFERLESIGEILKLNTSYKAPSDYKPIMKEVDVPVPVKEFPSYNFMGLLFGPGNDTLKRLEKETGAKIRVHGKKMGREDECEVTPADGGGEGGGSEYEELHLRISAETFDKVDAAVALIELLVKPVSGNQGSTPATASTSPPPPDPTSGAGSTQEPPTPPQVGVPQPPGLLPQTRPQLSAWPPPPPPPLHMSSPGYLPPVNVTPLSRPPFTPQPLFLPHSNPPPAVTPNPLPTSAHVFRQNTAAHPPPINSWRPPSGSISVHLRLPSGQPFHVPTLPYVGQNVLPPPSARAPPFMFQPPPSRTHQHPGAPDVSTAPPPPLPRLDPCTTASMPPLPPPPPLTMVGPTSVRTPPLPSPRPHAGFNDFTFQPQQNPPPKYQQQQQQMPAFGPAPAMAGHPYGEVPPPPLGQFTGNTNVIQAASSMGVTSTSMLPPPPPLRPNFGGHLPLRYAPAESLVGQQIYDPFSPTSSSSSSAGQKGPVKESDPEYEDLMASVGVM